MTLWEKEMERFDMVCCSCHSAVFACYIHIYSYVILCNSVVFVCCILIFIFSFSYSYFHRISALWRRRLRSRRVRRAILRCGQARTVHLSKYVHFIVLFGELCMRANVSECERMRANESEWESSRLCFVSKNIVSPLFRCPH